MKNKETSRSDEYIDMPEVDIDEVIARNILAKPSEGIIKK
tara:strand:+ start:1444 stop:1563 length:120 start_codon:yes stop_codon:yes gene_type:complete